MQRLLALAVGAIALGVALVTFQQPSRALFMDVPLKTLAVAGGSFAPVGSATTGQTFSGSTVSATLTGTTAGNAILGQALMQPSTGTLSISSGCTLGGTQGSGSGGQSVPFYCLNITGGSQTVTVTTTATITNSQIEIEQWSGIATSAANDGEHSTYTNGSSSTPLPCGSITTTSNGDLIWAGFITTQAVAPTIPTGYTANASGVGTGKWYSAYETQATAGAINPTYTSGASSFDNWVSCLAMKP